MLASYQVFFRALPSLRTRKILLNGPLRLYTLVRPSPGSLLLGFLIDGF